jgi:hypothetical protein
MPEKRGHRVRESELGLEFSKAAVRPQIPRHGMLTLKPAGMALALCYKPASTRGTRLNPKKRRRGQASYEDRRPLRA